MSKEYILVDKKVAQQFIHQYNHLDWQWVPKEILEMEITLRTDQRIKIGELVEDTKKRVGQLANYFKLALEHGKVEINKK